MKAYDMFSQPFWYIFLVETKGESDISRIRDMKTIKK